MPYVNKDQLWVLGVCDNKTKDFRIAVCKNRNASTLKHFIKSLVPKGNNIICDGWRGYEWIDEANSGYVRYVHIRERNDFGFGLESTSHIESIWAQLNAKNIYKSIPNVNSLFFLKEAEWKLKTKNLNFEQKLDDFFKMYNLIQTVGNIDTNDKYYLNNEEINLLLLI